LAVPELVVPYDPEWPQRFEEEAKRLLNALGQVVIEIELIGSTAVPGLSAKPTIDIAVGVSQLNDVGTGEISAMEELGYVYRGAAGVRGRHYFRQGATYPRDFHVSIIERRGHLWEEYPLLRGYLREHPEEAAAYVDAKREAERAIESPDPIGYWEHKRAFVEELLARAQAAA
jgi:GrpB-like predicted nucleotidyltransferase (UPF0157 family)